jgi:hypothetical protein
VPLTRLDLPQHRDVVEPAIADAKESTAGVAHLGIPPGLGQSRALPQLLRGALGGRSHSCREVGQHRPRDCRAAPSPRGELSPQRGDGAQATLHRVSEQFGYLCSRADPACGIRACPDDGGERDAVADHRCRQPPRAFDVHELDGADLPRLRYQDVDLWPRTVSPPHGPSAQAVPPAGLHTRHHRVGAAKEKRGVHELIDGRAPGEQQDDARQHSLPRPALETALVDGAFGNAMCDQLAHRRDAVRERCPQESGPVGGRGHQPIVLQAPSPAWVFGTFVRLRTSGKPRSCNVVA